jgi:MFS family permease
VAFTGGMPNLHNLLRPYECAEPPDGKLRGWLVLLASFSIYVVSVGFQYTTGVFYKAWVRSDEFGGAAPSTLAWANSIESAGFLCGAIFGGWVVSRSSSRVAALIGATCILAGTLIAAAYASGAPIGLLALLVGFGVLTGVGNSLTCLAAICSVQQYFSSRRGRVTGITVAGSGVGAFLLGPVLETLTNVYGWRVALVSYGVATAAVCVVCSAVLVPIVLTKAAGTVLPVAVSPPIEQAAGRSRRRLASLTAADSEFDLSVLQLPAPPQKGEEVNVASVGGASPSQDSAFSVVADASLPPASAARDVDASARLPSYADLIESPSLVTFCCCLTSGAILWFIIPTVG